MEPNNYESLIECLKHPSAYPEPVETVRHLETHISHLFLTGQHVYKVKKPVDFGFLDFTTREQRRFYCHRELTLNRRLSPEVYLDVVEIREEDGKFQIDGPGVTAEYAVKMLQLPQERTLSRLLDHGEVTKEDIARLARKIAAFHQEVETGPEITRLGSLEVVRENILENFAQTEKYVGNLLSREAFDDLRAYSQAFLIAKEQVFRGRAEAGRVRDCHGDLHSAQIFLNGSALSQQGNGISIIDCIEFNDRFRCSDVAEDIAFLAMDLDFHGRPDFSDLFVQIYREATGDRDVTQLVDFFKSYRAYVRGKVTAFRLDDPTLSAEERRQDTEIAGAYFQLAHSYTKIFPRPAIFLVCGLSGTGKSTLAAGLARRWDLEHISSDVTRKSLAGIPAEEHRYGAFGTGIYAEEFSRRTYEAMLQTAEETVSQGESIVLDGSFRRRAYREEVLQLARRLGIEAWTVECTLPEEEIRRRLDQRQAAGTSESDATWALFERQRADWQPILESETQRHLVLDTSGSKDDSVYRLLEGLFQKKLTVNGASPPSK